MFLVLSLIFKIITSAINAKIVKTKAILQDEDTLAYLMTCYSTAFLSIAITINIRTWMFYLFKIEETAMQNEDRPDMYNSERKIKFLDIVCAFSISLRAVYFGFITYQE